MTPEELEIAYRIAAAFHEAYERLAPSYSYKTREESAVAWDEVPEQNKLLMVDVIAELLDRRIIMAEPKLELEKRVDRIELAVSTMAGWLVQAQTGFGQKDAEGIEKILAGGALEGAEPSDTIEGSDHYPAAERQEEPGSEIPGVGDEQN